LLFWLAMQDRIHFRLLGGFGVTGDTPRPNLILSARQRALLAYLALRPDHSESRERLATLLWGDNDDGQARKRFRQSLLRLRRALAEAAVDPLVGDRDKLALDPGKVTVDAWEFLALAKAGEEADLARALDLYQGDLLDGVSVDVEPFDEWINQERLRFSAVAAQFFERYSRALDARGEAEGAIAAAERLVALDTANEAAQCRLIDLLARHRSNTAALMQAEVAAQVIKSELGCELEPETQRLIARIRSAPTSSPHPATKAEETRGAQAAAAVATTSPDAGALRPQFNAPPAALTDTATAVASPLSPHGASLQWRWAAAGIAVLLALATAVPLLRTAESDSPATNATISQSPSTAEAGSASGDTHAAAVSKAIEDSSTAAVIVLPFLPMPPEQAQVVHLADLISNDLINNLSRVPGFRVIARSMSIQFAKRPIDIGTLDKEFGVRYAIEGEVRLEDGKVRINIALIDVKTRLQVWAERYEREEAERTSAQDEIVRSLARQLHVVVMADRGRDTSGGGSQTINEKLGKAYAALNLFAFYRGGREGGELFEEVLRTDPNNVSALTGLGAFKAAAVNTRQTSEDLAMVLKQAESLLRQANAINPKASLPYYFLALIATRRGSADEALPLYQRTLEINPSYAPAYAGLGFLQMHAGRLAEAVENIKYAIRLSPKDNYLGLWSQNLGRAYLELGNVGEAEVWLTQSVTLMPNSPMSHLSLAAFLAERGDMTRAHEQAAELAKLAPRITMDEWITSLTLLCKQDEHRPARLIAGLRRAMAPTGSTQYR
jgi:DNA-binding SARP family transcriptional activator/TolB-like protein